MRARRLAVVAIVLALVAWPAVAFGFVRVSYAPGALRGVQVSLTGLVRADRQEGAARPSSLAMLFILYLF